jgi:hypothetical protein
MVVEQKNLALEEEYLLHQAVLNLITNQHIKKDKHI